MRVILLIALLVSSYTYSQKLSTPKLMDWSIQKGSTTSQLLFRYPPFANKILHASKTEVVGAVELTSKSWGIVKMDEKGIVKWTTPIKGITIGIGKMGEDLIAFYVDDKLWPKKITSILLDQYSGKVKKEKVIYESNEPYGFEINVLNRPSGDFDRLIVRLSEYKAGIKFMGGNTLLLSKTRKLNEIKLDKNLTAQTNSNIPTEVLKNDFIGCLVDNNSNSFYITQAGKNVIVEKIDSTGNPIAKLSANLGYTTKDYLHIFFKLDESDNSNVLIGLHSAYKDPANKIFRFDMNKGKVFESPTESLNKSYAKSLDLINLPSVMKAGFQDIETLEIREILSYADVYVVVKEVQGGRDSYGDRSDHLVVSFYDKELKHLKTTGLQKKFQTNSLHGHSIGIRKDFDKLFILTNASTGINRFATIFCAIDIKNMKIEKAELLNNSNIPAPGVSEPGATLWFDRSFFIQYMEAKGWPRIEDLNAILQKVEL